MTKTITIDGEDYEVNVEAAIKAGLLKKAVTHTTGDFYKDDKMVIYMLTIWEHVAYLIIVKGLHKSDTGMVYNYTKSDDIMSDFDFNNLATKKLTKIGCPIY